MDTGYSGLGKGVNPEERAKNTVFKKGEIKVEEARRKPPVSLGPLDDPQVLEKKSSVKADI